MIGLLCKKKSKPFKSGNQINTIKGVVINPNTGNPAFTFEEDDSCVDTYQCYLVDDDAIHSPVGKTDYKRQKSIHKKRKQNETTK